MRRSSSYTRGARASRSTGSTDTMVAERLEPLVWTHRQQPVAVADLDDAVVVLRLREFLPQQPLAQDAQLVPVQIADEIVDELGPGPIAGVNAVPPQLLENIGAIPIGLPRAAWARS